MNSRPGVTATTDMAVLLSELQALPSGLEALRAGSGAGSLASSGVPSTHSMNSGQAGSPGLCPGQAGQAPPATYRSGAPRLRSWISDFRSRIFDYN